MHARVRSCRGPAIIRGRTAAEERAAIDRPVSTIAPACVLTVDDQAEFRSALRRLIEQSSALVLLAEAASGEAAVNAVRHLEPKPDLVLMDVRMPGLGGIAATRAIKAIRPETAVFLVSSTPPEELSREADGLADATVWKGALSSELLDEIWAQHGGRSDGTTNASRPQTH